MAVTAEDLFASTSLIARNTILVVLLAIYFPLSLSLSEQSLPPCRYVNCGRQTLTSAVHCPRLTGDAKRTAGSDIASSNRVVSFRVHCVMTCTHDLILMIITIMRVCLHLTSMMILLVLPAINYSRDCHHTCSRDNDL